MHNLMLTYVLTKPAIALLELPAVYIVN